MRLFLSLGVLTTVVLSTTLANAQPPGGPEGGRGGLFRFLPILAALDTDGDGTISAAEIEQSVKALKSLDKSGDGKLTEDELRPAEQGRGGGQNGLSDGEEVAGAACVGDANTEQVRGGGDSRGVGGCSDCQGRNGGAVAIFAARAGCRAQADVEGAELPRQEGRIGGDAGRSRVCMLRGPGRKPGRGSAPGRCLDAGFAHQLAELGEFGLQVGLEFLGRTAGDGRGRTDSTLWPREALCALRTSRAGETLRTRRTVLEQVPHGRPGPDLELLRVEFQAAKP